MRIIFTHERSTKNTERFQEVSDSGALKERDMAEIGVLYLKKSATNKLQWKPGQRLIVTLSVEG